MQTTNTIKWEYLDEASLTLMDRLGVQRQDSGITFSRTLNRSDLFTVYFCLLKLERLSNKLDGDHANFATGDCLNEAAKLFGKDCLEAFAKEADEIRHARDLLFRLSGEALQRLQFLERSILTCCACIELNGLKLTLHDLLADDRKTSRIMLGRLKDGLLKTKAFDAKFEERFENFVEARNRFIHRLWLEGNLATPNLQTIERLITFTLDLVSEANFMDQVFKGLFAALLTERARNNPQLAKQPGFEIQGVNFIPIFESVLRSSSKS